MSETAPYVSFVIAGRNDDYGGDFNERLTNSITQLSFLFEKYKMPGEYIIVNYNPVADKPPLREVIKFPRERKFLKFRIITVAPELHKKITDPQVRKPLPLYEYVAKNTGIRRAKGEFICAANPDIIFHPRIVQWLAKKPLKENCYYRTDRCDFKKPAPPPPANAAKFIDWLKPSLFRTYLKGFHYDHHYSPEISLPFLRAYNNVQLKLEIFFANNPKYAKPVKWVVNFHNAEYHFHCNVSGDFMMMHRDRWRALHGYPENTFLALHTDALFVVTAGVSGLKEKVLQWPVFHQDHGRRYDAQKDEFDPEMRSAYLYFQDEAQQMMREKKAKIYNANNWGLSEYSLDEEEF